MALALREASVADIAWIMGVERMPGYERLVGRWDADTHARSFGDDSYRTFIGEEDGAPVGFVLVRGWNAADHVTLLKRVAIVTPGEGTGTRLVSAVLAEIFSHTVAHRVCIGCFPDNLRARKAYEKAGFVAEGISRGSAYFHGEHHDELVLAILRPEWVARHRL